MSGVVMTSEGADSTNLPGKTDQLDARVASDPVAGKTVAEILGEIVWLMTQSAAGREMKVSEIEQLVMPAILQRQFHIKYAQVPDMRRPGETALQPVSVNIAVLDTTASKQDRASNSVISFSLKGWETK